MKRRLQQLMAVLIATILALVLSVSSADAAPPSRATLKAVAEKVAAEVVHGSLYGKDKKAYPQLNWTHDGCSVPVWEIAVFSGAAALAAAYYKSLFVDSCNRHDFGYRNFGKNTSSPGPHYKFDPTRTRKNAIDSRFKSNMKVECSQDFSHWYQIVNREACYGAADAFYEAVSHFGDSSFF